MVLGGSTAGTELAHRTRIATSAASDRRRGESLYTGPVPGDPMGIVCGLGVACGGSARAAKRSRASTRERRAHSPWLVAVPNAELAEHRGVGTTPKDEGPDWVQSRGVAEMKTKSSIVGASIAAALTLGVAGVAYAYADPTTIDSGAISAPNTYYCQSGYTCMWDSSASGPRTAWYKANINSFAGIGYKSNNSVAMTNTVSKIAPNQNSYPSVTVYANAGWSGSSACLNNNYLYTPAFTTDSFVSNGSSC